MPLIKSGSHEAMKNNIREMVKAGHPLKQAVAAAFAQKRKYMAHGGIVEDSEEDEGSIDAGGDMGAPGMPVYPMGDDQEGLSENTMHAEMLAEHLQSKLYAANNNHVSYKADDPMAGHKIYDGSLTEDKDALHAALGAKPEVHEGDGAEEPMSDEPAKSGKIEHELPQAHLDALAEKKKKRRFR